MKNPDGYTADRGLYDHVKSAHLGNEDKVEAQKWFKRMGYWIQDNGIPKKYTKSERNAFGG